ncbi:MAG: replicative DNA helicase [Alphaproteobacteria bacterium]|nr:replicative DNA helicase [Alphaproteobacteria bacterium]
MEALDVTKYQNQKDTIEELDVMRLPRNVEAEQALIGALLANNKAYEKISEFLRPNHFSDPIHVKVFDIIARLIQKGHVADVITLKNYFEQEGTLNDVGGIAYLIKLSEASSPLTNVEYYAQFIYDKYLRRELISTGYDIASEAMNEKLDETTANQIEKAEKRLFELAMHGDGQKGFQDFGTSLNQALELIAKAYQKEGKVSGLSTGLNELDYKLGGLNDSDLLILAGRPAMGKSALAMNIAYNVAENMMNDENMDPHSKGVAIFSLEMSADQLASRILSSITDTSGKKLRTGDMELAEFNRIAAAVREYQRLPLYIDDTPGITINTIRTRARRLKRTHGLGLIVIDYIQLISGSDGKKNEGNRVQEVSEISRGLKILAKELKVPVIALSQLNRGLEQREDKRPLMSDLRESGSIEQDADIVMFVFRENYYIQNAEPKRNMGETDEHFLKRTEEWQQKDRETKNIGEVIIGKHRHGSTGTVKLFWNGEYARFSNLTREEYLPEQRG